uniref:Uncharacterized protein n=1 Tax=Setaria digitata TaxID=48799 RepID=A0A915PKY7_9BILA
MKRSESGGVGGAKQVEQEWRVKQGEGDVAQGKEDVEKLEWVGQ